MLNSNSYSQKNTKLSLEQLKEKLPRTPYDKATWIEDFFKQEK